MVVSSAAISATLACGPAVRVPSGREIVGAYRLNSAEVIDSLILATNDSFGHIIRITLNDEIGLSYARPEGCGD